MRVYLETTVVSYLAADPSRDVVIAGHQQSSHEWWRSARERYTVVASQLVVREASAGDPVAAVRRRALLDGIALLRLGPEASALARDLVAAGLVPERALEDALHIAIAVVGGCEYLVTWNYRHLANAAVRSRVEDYCRGRGYVPAIICTPEELLEE